MPIFLEIPPGHVTTLVKLRDGSQRCHEFDERCIGAVNAAIATGRPLLVRGEPGLGKSQLAEAVAEQLEKAFLPFVVDSRTEHRDLLWRFDAVERLAEAQLANSDSNADAARSKLAITNFVRPGPFWWVFDSGSAERAAGQHSANYRQRGKNLVREKNGWVLLIDEIDKAESDLPNGLLEALGALEFTPLGQPKPVVPREGADLPLVIVTTNEERTLPPAFLRRCIILKLNLPTDRTDFVNTLVRRGQAHFGPMTAEALLSRCAEKLWEIRDVAPKGPGNPLPGQAEFIDTIRALANRYPNDYRAQLTNFDEASRFILRKHSD